MRISGPFSFTANRAGSNYVGGLALPQVADVLSIACGSGGSGAEYLYQTVVALHALGLADPYLWELQALVADRIEAMETEASVSRQPNLIGA